MREYGWKRGAFEMFADTLDPFGLHKALEPSAPSGSVCPPENCA